MDDHSDLVAQIKAKLQASGVSLDGPCGAFAITKRVAWALRGQGAGLLDKPGGNQCEGFATDIVMFPDGSLVDILGDGGGANTPMWNVTGEIRPTSQFRPAVDPGDEVPPVKPDAGTPSTTGLDAVSAKLDTLAAALASLDQKLDAIAKQSDANTEKIQSQINEVVKNAEKSVTAALPLFGGLLGGGHK